MLHELYVLRLIPFLSWHHRYEPTYCVVTWEQHCIAMLACDAACVVCHQLAAAAGCLHLEVTAWTESFLRIYDLFWTHSAIACFGYLATEKSGGTVSLLWFFEYWNPKSDVSYISRMLLRRCVQVQPCSYAFLKVLGRAILQLFVWGSFQTSFQWKNPQNNVSYLKEP